VYLLTSLCLLRLASADACVFPKVFIELMRIRDLYNDLTRRSKCHAGFSQFLEGRVCAGNQEVQLRESNRLSAGVLQLTYQ
jgi:hypothetical protein